MTNGMRNTNTNPGRRYSPAEKREIIDHVLEVNRRRKRGGRKEAAAKFGVAAITISGWMKADRMRQPEGAPAAAPATLAVPAGQGKGKAAQGKAATRGGATTRKSAAKKAAPAKAAAAKKLAGSRGRRGRRGRYSKAAKARIIRFVSDHDQRHGRGGQAAAVSKFGVTAPTISEWMKAQPEAAATSAKATKATKATKAIKGIKGIKPTKPPGSRVAVGSAFPARLLRLAELHDRIVAAKASLAAMEAEFGKLKGAL